VESRTVTVALNAPREQAFAFLSEVENAPKWAVEFIQELKRVGGDYHVVTPMGELLYRVQPDDRTGVIDILVGPSQEELGLFPTRVIALAGDRSAYQFTMFRAPGVPDAVFQDQYDSLRREMAHLQRLFE
jgi:hypothetical protein